MVTATPAREAAELIFEKYQTVQPFDRLPDRLFPKTLDDAYAIQLELHCLLSSLWGPLAGYKLAYTTPVMQERAGLDHPVLGGVFEKTILRSPVVLNFTEYVNLGIELEVGVTLGKDLPASGAPYTRDSVADAVAEVATAFEIVDIRTPDDLTTEERTLLSVAVNILNSGVVLGDPVTDWQSLDLVGCHGVMKSTTSRWARATDATSWAIPSSRWSGWPTSSPPATIPSRPATPSSPAA